MNHVIITGGAGFIGSHLCERFISAGYAVTAIDNFCTGSKENIHSLIGNEYFQIIEADISEPIEKEKISFLRKYGLNGILHFACPASPIDFDKIPFEILKVDSIGTMHTVELALEYEARYLLASTSEIYGDPEIHPQTEDYWGNVNTIGPRACYDEAKRFSEAYVSTAINAQGTINGKPYTPLNGGMVRIFNTYGPRMRPDDGRVVPALCTQGLTGKPLTVYGDGLQTRSFCFVTDLVEGIFRYYNSTETIPINLGNPVEHTVKSFAEIIIEMTKSGSSIEFLPARVDDPKRRRPDITRAKTRLDWIPKVPLEEGLSKTIEFFKSKTRI